MSKKIQNINIAAIKYARQASREAEIAAHGKPLPQTHVQQSKKIYDRKKSKATFKNEPLPFLCKKLTPKFKTHSF
jgi:hypothetical protein